MTVKLERIDYGGWTACYRLSNDAVDLVLTTDVGPRIIRYGFVSQENEFKEFGEMLGKTGGDQWRVYGGHRLWHAPESTPRTYYPDNDPVTLEESDGFVRLVQSTEPTTGIQKEMDIRLDASGSGVEVTHRLRNLNLWSVELAPWALSVMAPGGTAILPLPPRGSHPQDLTPTSSLALWPYTNMADPRWTWGSRFILLRQNQSAEKPQKIGLSPSDGWLAYARNGHLFVKQFTPVPGSRYPDLGCAVELFTDGSMLEMETLGPLTTLAPQAAIEHVERWRLFDGVPAPRDDEDVVRTVLDAIAL